MYMEKRVWEDGMIGVLLQLLASDLVLVEGIAVLFCKIGIWHAGWRDSRGVL